MLTRMPVEGYTGTCEAIRDADLTEAARMVEAHTLILCGTEDVSTPPDLVRGVGRTHAKCRIPGNPRCRPFNLYRAT